MRTQFHDSKSSILSSDKNDRITTKTTCANNTVLFARIPSIASIRSTDLCTIATTLHFGRTPEQSKKLVAAMAEVSGFARLSGQPIA
jgi:hypothetical protein